MHKPTKLLVAALLAILTCALMASSATANRSIEVIGGPNVQASGRLTFFGEGAGTEILCDVTLLRTVARLIPKISGTLFGKLTGIAFNRGETARSPRCAHGAFIREVHDILPLLGPERICPHRELGGGVLLYDCSGAEARLWKLIYDSFQGTLPEIEGINFHVQNVQFLLRLLEPFGGTIECLYEGSVFGLITVSRRTISRGRALPERTRLPFRRGSALCPRTGQLSGEFTVRPTLTIELV